MLEAATRAVFAFLILLLLTRLIGKKQISQLTYFNYVTGIAYGTIGAALIISPNISISYIITALVVFSGMTILSGFLSLKSKNAKLLFDGKPTIVIRNGQIQVDVLAKERLNIDDMLLLLRKKDIFSISDVDYAIFETNGEITVLKKVDTENVKIKDIAQTNINVSIPSRVVLPTEVIVEGKIQYDKLTEVNLDNNWLNRELDKANTSLQDIFYAEIKSDGSLFINKYSDILH